jgi:hypothetical protein
VQVLAKALQQRIAAGADSMTSEEAVKILRESQSQGAGDPRAQKGNSSGPSAAGGRPGVNARVTGAIVGSGNQMSEVDLVPNKILMLAPHAQRAPPHAINQKLSINTLQAAFGEIAKQT